MNYRHAFHAGNFADVFKHIVLTRILDRLTRKDAPFRVIDTHAGVGLYDLAGDEATRAGEWRGGVALLNQERMNAAAEEIAAPYRALIGDVRRAHGPTIYPGSPEIARRMTRPQDRLLLAEAHSDTADALRAALGRDRRVKILAQDGWTVLKAAIPPPERRGLALIDPAFEQPNEFATIARALPAAWRKWPKGVYALWYPIKDVGVVERAMHEIAQSGVEKALRAELFIDDPAARGLNGCGMLIINPPWTLAEDLNALLPELARLLGRGAARWRNDWLAPERAPVPSDAPAASVKPSGRKGKTS